MTEQTMFDPNNPTPEQLEKHFDALNHSVSLINTLVEAGDNAQDKLDTVKRNYQHIDIMLDKDFIKNDSRDKSAFTNASASGKQFVGE